MALPPLQTEPSKVSASTALRDGSPLRHRPLGRSATFGDILHTPTSRRSSNLSDSSLRSSARNIFSPTTQPEDEAPHGEVSHWHSAPLTVAVVPALAGLIFHNGSVIITDLTLLGLAAFALNWALRIPWEWYHAAQAEATELDEPLEDSYHSDTIVEENENGEATQDEGAEAEVNRVPPQPGHHYKQGHDATASLRQRQTVALIACFLFPVLMTWILHHLRASLSRPAEGLISNTNLTIFLFAAEFRPCHEVGKMFQARTLYLQKALATSTGGARAQALGHGADDLTSLIQRVSDLEGHVVANEPSASTSHNSEADMITAVRKSIQPELDALNRAVRRYEKRATVQTMETDSRLQGLEARMSDAITLAAAAERSVSHARESTRLIPLVSGLVTWPISLVTSVVDVALQLLTLPYTTASNYVRPKIEREKRTAGLSSRRESRTRHEDDRRKGTSRGLRKAL